MFVERKRHTRLSREGVAQGRPEIEKEVSDCDNEGNRSGP